MSQLENRAQSENVQKVSGKVASCMRLHIKNSWGSNSLEQRRHLTPARMGKIKQHPRHAWGKGRRQDAGNCYLPQYCSFNSSAFSPNRASKASTLPSAFPLFLFSFSFLSVLLFHRLFPYTFLTGFAGKAVIMKVLAICIWFTSPLM